MTLYLVSKFKRFAALFFILVLLTSTVLIAFPEEAQATPVSSGRAITYFSLQQPTSLNQSARPELAALALPTAGTRQAFPWDAIGCAATVAVGGVVAGPVGIGAAAAAGAAGLGPCGEVVDSVTEFVGEAIDCVAAALDCVTEWIFDLLGGAVAWAARGVVTLVVGVNQECIRDAAEDYESPVWNDDPTQGGSVGNRLSSFRSGMSWTASQEEGCANRIEDDYFNERNADIDAFYAELDATASSGVAALQRELTALDRDGEGQSPRALQITALIAEQGAAQVDQGVTDAALQALARQNGTWASPKSTVSTPTFQREYGKYVLISVLLLVPFIIAAALQSVITGKPGAMMRGVFIHLPVAIFGMLVTPYLVKTLMMITDSFSSFIIGDVGSDIDGFFQDGNRQLSLAFLASGKYILIPAVIVVLFFLLAAMMVWFILNIREASIALVSVFMPIAFAASVWPALGKWAIRAIKLLIAAIISKIFIVGAISLGLGVFGGSTEGGFSFSHLVYGATIFAIAAFSPNLVLKFMDEIGDSMTNGGSSGALAKAGAAAGLLVNAKALPGVSAATKALGGNKGGGGDSKGSSEGDHGSRGGGGPGVATSAGMKGLATAKKALAGGATKLAAANSGAKEAASQASAGGGSSAEQGQAAANAYSASGGPEGNDGAIHAGGLAAAAQSRIEGNSPTAIGQAGGEGVLGAGGSPEQAGVMAYATASANGASREQAQALRQSFAAPAAAPQQSNAARVAKSVATRGFGGAAVHGLGGAVKGMMNRRSQAKQQNESA